MSVIDKITSDAKRRYREYVHAAVEGGADWQPDDMEAFERTLFACGKNPDAFREDVRRCENVKQAFADKVASRAAHDECDEHMMMQRAVKAKIIAIREEAERRVVPLSSEYYRLEDEARYALYRSHELNRGANHTLAQLGYPVNSWRDVALFEADTPQVDNDNIDSRGALLRRPVAAASPHATEPPAECVM